MKRGHTIGDCYLFEQGPMNGQLIQDKQGWAYVDWLFQSFSTYAAEGLVDKDNTLGEFMKLSLVSNADIKRVICTPYMYVGTTSDIGQWATTGAGNWYQTDKLDPLINGVAAKRIINRDASGTFGSRESIFTVPQGGSWTFVIRRASPKNDKDTNNCATYIEFDRYLLYMPFNSGMGLYKNFGGQWYRVKDIYLPDNNSQMNEEGNNALSISFINLDGMLCFSGDGFKNFDVYREPDYLYPKDYKIKISHVGSAWQYNFYPTKMQEGKFYNLSIPVYYETDKNYIFDDMGKYLPEGTDIVIEDDPDNESTETEVNYRVTMTPILADGDFYVTPELEGVLIKHKPQVQQLPVPYINLAAPDGIDGGNGERLISINGDESIEFDSATWQIELSNEDAALSNPDNGPLFLNPFKLIKLRAGYVLENGTQYKKTMFTGVVLTPSFLSTQTVKNLVTVRIANLAYLCEQTFNKGDWPPFDGWTIKEALEWLALRCRIRENRHVFYQTDEILYPDSPMNSQLSRGTPDDPLWAATVLQTSAWELMKKIADYIKYDIYFDRNGNLICKPKQFGWDGLYQHAFFCSEFAPDLTTGELDTFNVATNVELVLQGEDYYNTVYIGGLNGVGGSIATFKTDIDSIYNTNDPNHVGFEKAIAVAYDTVVTQEKTEEIANSIFYDFLMYPRKISFVTYFNPDVLPGDVIKVVGSSHKIIGGNGADAKYYRICNLNHDITMKGLSTTNVVATFIGTQADAEAILGA